MMMILNSSDTNESEILYNEIPIFLKKGLILEKLKNSQYLRQAIGSHFFIVRYGTVPYDQLLVLDVLRTYVRTYVVTYNGKYFMTIAHLLWQSVLKQILSNIFLFDSLFYLSPAQNIEYVP